MDDLSVLSEFPDQRPSRAVGANLGQLTQLHEDSARGLKLGTSLISAVPGAPLISLDPLGFAGQMDIT